MTKKKTFEEKWAMTKKKVLSYRAGQEWMKSPLGKPEKKPTLADCGRDLEYDIKPQTPPISTRLLEYLQFQDWRLGVDRRFIILGEQLGASKKLWAGAEEYLNEIKEIVDRAITNGTSRWWMIRQILWGMLGGVIAVGILVIMAWWYWG